MNIKNIQERRDQRKAHKQYAFEPFQDIHCISALLHITQAQPPPCSQWQRNLLEDVFPCLAVIESMAPAHLHSADNDVLFEDVWAQLPVEIITLVQWDLEYTQHEPKYSTWGKNIYKHSNRESHWQVQADESHKITLL